VTESSYRKVAHCAVALNEQADESYGVAYLYLYSVRWPRNSRPQATVGEHSWITLMTSIPRVDKLFWPNRLQVVEIAAAKASNSYVCRVVLEPFLAIRLKVGESGVGIDSQIKSALTYALKNVRSCNHIPDRTTVHEYKSEESGPYRNATRYTRICCLFNADENCQVKILICQIQAQSPPMSS